MFDSQTRTHTHRLLFQNLLLDARGLRTRKTGESLVSIFLIECNIPILFGSHIIEIKCGRKKRKTKKYSRLPDEVNVCIS